MLRPTLVIRDRDEVDIWQAHHQFVLGLGRAPDPKRALSPIARQAIDRTCWNPLAYPLGIVHTLQRRVGKPNSYQRQTPEQVWLRLQLSTQALARIGSLLQSNVPDQPRAFASAASGCWAAYRPCANLQPKTASHKIKHRAARRWPIPIGKTDCPRTTLAATPAAKDHEIERGAAAAA